MTDRDLRAWLPQIELADFAGPIDGPLIGPRPGEQRADLAQVVIDDRLAPVEPQRRDQLTDPLPGQRRVLPEQSMDLVLERIELRPNRLAPIPRRLRRAQRRPDRVARQSRPPRELLDRHPPDEVLATNLAVLHTDQPFLLTSTTTDRARLNTPPDASATPEGGRFSIGGGGSVFRA
jgi:hypothetical protein